MKLFSIERITSGYGVKAETKIWLKFLNIRIKLLYHYGLKYYQWVEPISIMYSGVSIIGAKYMTTNLK